MTLQRSVVNMVPRRLAIGDDLVGSAEPRIEVQGVLNNANVLFGYFVINKEI